jgi:hypothetical protein
MPADAAAAIRKVSRLNSGLKPGAILNAFFAVCAGQPVCLAIQPIQMKMAQVDSIMTENQSTALIAPRFIVGKPKAARIASMGSKWQQIRFHPHRDSAVRAAAAW